jgi:hypothetical protein
MVRSNMLWLRFVVNVYPTGSIRWFREISIDRRSSQFEFYLNIPLNRGLITIDCGDQCNVLE